MEQPFSRSPHHHGPHSNFWLRHDRMASHLTRYATLRPRPHTASGKTHFCRAAPATVGQFPSRLQRIFTARTVMRILKQTFLLLRKDLLLETRRRESLLTMFFFGTLLLFVFHFSFDLTPERVAEMAPALLWLAFLFTGTLGLAQLFEAERSNHCLDALLLSPMDRGALFLAKVCFNITLMVLVEIVVIPLFWILFNLRSWELIPLLFLMALLGT